jgi:hypothetical protein
MFFGNVCADVLSEELMDTCRPRIISAGVGNVVSRWGPTPGTPVTARMRPRFQPGRPFDKSLRTSVLPLEAPTRARRRADISAYDDVASGAAGTCADPWM